MPEDVHWAALESLKNSGNAWRLTILGWCAASSWSRQAA
jgi:hypothetical protein